jgi:hypothetical protein
VGGGGGGFGFVGGRGGCGSLEDGAHVVGELGAGLAFAAAVDAVGLDGLGAGTVGLFAVAGYCLAPAADPIGLFALVPAREELLAGRKPVDRRCGVLSAWWRPCILGLCFLG